MTAAALAFRTAEPMANGGAGTALALALVLLGGLMEGSALGFVQSVLLGRVYPRLRRRRYVVATVLVAGLGWSAAAAPSVLTRDDGGGGMPSLLLVLPAAAGLGLVMGAVLGAAQAWSLRGAVQHPWHWVAANVTAWPGVMAVIFLGAGIPGSTWRLGAVLVVALGTGAAAGAVLGLVTGLFLPSLVSGHRPGGNGRDEVGVVR